MKRNNELTNVWTHLHFNISLVGDHHITFITSTKKPKPISYLFGTQKPNLSENSFLEMDIYILWSHVELSLDLKIGVRSYPSLVSWSPKPRPEPTSQKCNEPEPPQKCSISRKQHIDLNWCWEQCSSRVRRRGNSPCLRKARREENWARPGS